MKKIGKTSITPEKVIKNDELVNLKGACTLKAKCYLQELLIAVLILLIISGPALGQNNESPDLPVVDLTKLPKNENQVNLSEFASEVMYLPLETKAESLIGPSSRFYLYDSIIVCCAHHQILTFDSRDGKFLRAIGEFGRGPNGYLNSKGSYLKNGEIIITAIGANSPLVELSANGIILQKIKPERYTSDIIWLTDDLYVIYYNKHSNSDDLKLQIYDSGKDKVLSTVYDHREFKQTSKIVMFGAFFYRYNDQVFIKEYFNDTVFQITPEKLVPTIVFESGKYSPPFYEKETFNFVEYHNINTILDTDNLLFFKLVFNKRTYYCYFNKGTEEVRISNYKNQKINDFENDLDGFMPFQPNTINRNNSVLISYLQPFEILQWFEENPENAAKLPPELKKFKNIDLNDNPVLMLVKLKE